MTKSVFLSHRIFITQHVEHLQSRTYKVHSRSALRKSSPLFAIHPILPASQGGTCGDGVWWPILHDCVVSWVVLQSLTWRLARFAYVAKIEKDCF